MTPIPEPITPAPTQLLNRGANTSTGFYDANTNQRLEVPNSVVGLQYDLSSAYVNKDVTTGKITGVSVQPYYTERLNEVNPYDVGKVKFISLNEIEKAGGGLRVIPSSSRVAQSENSSPLNLLSVDVQNLQPANLQTQTKTQEIKLGGVNVVESSSSNTMTQNFIYGSSSQSQTQASNLFVKGFGSNTDNPFIALTEQQKIYERNLQVKAQSEIALVKEERRLEKASSVERGIGALLLPFVNPSAGIELIGAGIQNFLNDNKLFNVRPSQYSAVSLQAKEKVTASEKGTTAYVGNVATNLGTYYVTGAAAGAAFGAVSKVASPLYSASSQLGGEVVGKALVSKPAQVLIGTGAGIVYGKEFVEPQVKSQGGTALQAESAFYTSMAGLAGYAPAAISGAKLAQQFSPIRGTSINVPNAVPETRLKIGNPFTEPLLKRVPTGNEVIVDTRIGAAVYNENNLKPFWESKTNMEAVRNAKPPLIDFKQTDKGVVGFLPKTEYEFNVLTRPKVFTELGKANGLTADIAEAERGNLILRLAKPMQGVKSEFLNFEQPFTKTTNPRQTAGMNLVDARLSENPFNPSIKQIYGSYSSSRQQPQQFVAQSGDVDVITNLKIGKDSGSLIGRGIYKITGVDSGQRLAEQYVAASKGKSDLNLNIKVSPIESGIRMQWNRAYSNNLVAKNGKVVDLVTGKTARDIHLYGTGELPPEVAGLKLSQPNVYFKGSKVPFSSLSQETASTAARNLGMYRTPDNRIIISPPSNKPSAPAQFFRNFQSSFESAKQQGKLSAGEIKQFEADALSFRKLRWDIPDTEAKYSEFKGGRLPKDYIGVKEGSRPVSFSLTPKSGGFDFSSSFSKAKSPNPFSPSPSASGSGSSLYSPYSPSPSPSGSSSSSSGGSSSISSTYSSYSYSGSSYSGSSSSSSSSSASSSSSSSYGYTFPTMSFLGVPTPPSLNPFNPYGSGTLGKSRKPKTKYQPSLFGILSGRTVSKAPRNLSGGEIRYPILYKPPNRKNKVKRPRFV